MEAAPLRAWDKSTPQSLQVSMDGSLHPSKQAVQAADYPIRTPLPPHPSQVSLAPPSWSQPEALSKPQKAFQPVILQPAGVLHLGPSNLLLSPAGRSTLSFLRQPLSHI